MEKLIPLSFGADLFAMLAKSGKFLEELNAIRTESQKCLHNSLHTLVNDPTALECVNAVRALSPKKYLYKKEAIIT